MTPPICHPHAPQAAVRRYLEREHGWRVAPEAIVWLQGVVPALTLVCRAAAAAKKTTTTGDAAAAGASPRGDDDALDVMTHVPIYPPFKSSPGVVGGRALEVPLRRAVAPLDDDDDEAAAAGGGGGGGAAAAAARWTFDGDAMEAAVTPATRVFLLCSPHNPTGRVWTRAELRRLGAFAEKHDLVICSDEVGGRGRI